MKKITTYIISLLLLLPVLAGCSADTPGAGEEPDTAQGYTLRLFLDAGSVPAPSRAPSDGEYDPGSGYENFIDIEGRDFRVMLFTDTDEWLATVNPALSPDGLLFLPATGDINNPAGSKRYRLEFKADPSVVDRINASHKVKVVILANWRGNYPEPTASTRLGDLFSMAEAITYNVLPTSLDSDDDRIAMFGVTQFDGVTIRPDNVNLLGNIHLLRALAKVEVTDNIHTSLFIKEIALTRHYTVSAPMPSGVTHQDHYVKGSWAGDYVKHPSLPTGAAAHESASEVPLVKNSRGVWTIYLPEFDNGGAYRSLPEQHARLRLTFDGIAGNYYIDFRDYSAETDDAYFDILRNNIYRFDVTKPYTGEINIQVDIIPFSEVKLDPEFGLEREPINGWLVLRNSQGYILCYYDRNYRIFYDRDYQEITFEQVAGTSFVTVTDHSGAFAWFIDVHTGNILDNNRQPLTGIERQDITGRIIRRTAGGVIEYTLDPLSITVYDRGNVEVQLEKKPGTAGMKILRDDKQREIYHFDAVLGLLYDTKDRQVTLKRDNLGRIVIPDASGALYVSYDPSTGVFYDKNNKPILNSDNSIKNPFSVI